MAIAVALGKWPEAAMVVFLFAVAEAIEALSLERARNAIRARTAIAPETAEVKAGEAWEAKPVAEVAVGSRIPVRVGARVPLAARVEFGHAALNQAPITGESVPADKQAGGMLYAGSIVANGVVEATVTASAGDSTLPASPGHAERAVTARADPAFRRSIRAVLDPRGRDLRHRRGHPRPAANQWRLELLAV